MMNTGPMTQVSLLLGTIICLVAFFPNNNYTLATNNNYTLATNNNDTQATNANDTLATNNNDTQATNANDTQATNANDTQATNNNDTQATNANYTASSNNEENQDESSDSNNNGNPEDYDSLSDLVNDIKVGVVDTDKISLNSFQNSGAYQEADEQTQDCIDLAGKIGSNLIDYEIVHCSKDPNHFKNQIANNE